MSRLLSTLTLVALTSTLAGCGTKPGASADSSSAASPAAASSAATPAATPSAPSTPDPRVTAADQSRIKGDSAAKLWIMVVSDFQCPYCGQWEKETAAAVDAEFVKTGKARLAFLNFPLQQHPNAMPAAEAAMCAGAQGKFWEMHDRIFETQSEWSALPDAGTFFYMQAGKLGVDLPTYTACIGEHVMRPMILADADRATTAGARSTPTFFIGDQVLSGAEKIDAFRTAIAKATAALPK